MGVRKDGEAINSVLTQERVKVAKRINPCHQGDNSSILLDAAIVGESPLATTGSSKIRL